MRKKRYRSNKQHPELRRGEVFLSNVRDPFNDELGIRDAQQKGWYAIRWRTKRIGNQAYDIYGAYLSYMRPVFVKRKELEDAGINTDTLLG